MLPARDMELVQIVDRNLVEAGLRARKADGSSWLTCRPGCTPCCHGVFRISMLDAERLRATFEALILQEPERAAAIRERVEEALSAWTPIFPGDSATGLLVEEDDPAWEVFADLPETDRPCPVLDPATGRCDLYTGRPLTCRVFGPPVQNEGGLGVCELCYVGASEDEILAGEMHLEHQVLEAELDSELPPGETIIAWALARHPV
jgi:Fe-S-cluster containining protein